MNKRKSRPSESKRFKIFQLDKFTCQYCGEKAPNIKLELDHIKPVALGGGDEINNLITSCKECNIGKGAKKIIDPSILLYRTKRVEDIKNKTKFIPKVYNKVRKYCFEKNVTIDSIASYLGISRQTIWGWKSRPIKHKDAVNLVDYTENYITMKDCGYGS